MTKRNPTRTQHKIWAEALNQPGVFIDVMDNDLPLTLSEIRKFQDKTKFQKARFEHKLYKPS